MPTDPSTPLTDPISGYCDPAFAPIQAAFEKNFAERGEVGAACCLYIDGKKVVDIWGGHQDREQQKPWQEDTLVGFYSVGKALAALCTLQLVDQGKLDLDKPVAAVWPEFAAAGKESITLRQALAHQASLTGIEQRLSNDDLFNWPVMAQALADQAPWYPVTSKAIYHTNTYGFLIGEPLRRVTGLTVGEYLQQHISGPLQEEVFFGVPTEQLHRIANIVWHPHDQPPPPEFIEQPTSHEQQMINLGYFNPPGFSGLGVMNSTAWRQAEVPSTNGHGTARGIAHIYQLLAMGGEHKGIRLLGEDTLKEATRIHSENECPVLERPVCFGLGFQPTRNYRQFGPNPNSYGHFGSGGSVGFADPDARLGFSYTMNDIIPRWQSPRNQALIDAIYECL
jgi:CubicO group peptidase (beta-lactamase class C family)